MNWHTKLGGKNITHADLDNLGISVENLRKTKALNHNKFNRYSPYRIIDEPKESAKDKFIIKR